jgi:hypothetical protein
MLDDAAKLADGSKSMLEAATIVAELLALAGKFHRQRLAEPHLAPARARRVSDDRPRAVVLSSVAGFIPWVDAVESEI